MTTITLGAALVPNLFTPELLCLLDDRLSFLPAAQESAYGVGALVQIGFRGNTHTISLQDEFYAWFSHTDDGAPIPSYFYHFNTDQFDALTAPIVQCTGHHGFESAVETIAGPRIAQAIPNKQQFSRYAVCLRGGGVLLYDIDPYTTALSGPGQHEGPFTKADALHSFDLLIDADTSAHTRIQVLQSANAFVEATLRGAESANNGQLAHVFADIHVVFSIPPVPNSR